MAKINNLPAESYAKPHTMGGQTLKGFGKNATAAAKVAAGTTVKDPNTLPANKMTIETAVPRVSAGDPARENVKTTGVKQRGSGVATKGFTSRGPLA